MAVNQWISSESEPKTIRGGTSDLTKDFFRELWKVGEWLSNEVRFLTFLNLQYVRKTDYIVSISTI